MKTQDLYLHIGTKIRELRQNYGARGISQERLAAEMGTTSNTISRWETASYKPSAADLERLARFFGVGINVFFPTFETSRLQALMSATGELSDEDIDDVTRYAQFRKARQLLESHDRKRK